MSIIGDGIMLGAGGESASIVVTAPTGSTVTCTTPAGIVLTAAEVSGTWTFVKLKVYGTYTVTATTGTRSKTQDVLIDAAIEYSVNISFRLTVISNNDLHEDVTGGYTYTSSVWGLSVDSDGNVKVTRNGSWTTPPTTNNSIDLTEYSTFYVRSKQDAYSGGVWVYDESDSGLSSGVELCLYTDKNVWVELTGSLSELGITGKKRIQLAGNAFNIWYSDLWFE